jgi:hypothetical protein
MPGEPKWLSTSRDAMKRKASPAGPSLAEKTAADWIRPGGGYDEWKKGDPAREQRLPIGGMEPADEGETHQVTDRTLFKPWKKAAPEQGSQ